MQELAIAQKGLEDLQASRASESDDNVLHLLSEATRQWIES
jgi:hypothetical protein